MDRMAMNREVELGSVQQRVVDNLHLVVCLCGLLTIGAGFLRGHFVLGRIEVSVPAIASLAFVALSYLFRRWIPWIVRSWVLLLGLLVSGGNSLWVFGVSGTAGILLMIPVIIAWLIWPRIWAWLVSLLAILSMVLVAAKNILSGCEFEGVLSEFNRSSMVWLNLGFVYISTAAMLLVVSLSLLRSWRRAADHALDRERESKEDRDRLSGILQGIHDAIFVHDPEDGRVVELHGRVEGMYGIPPERILQEGFGIVSAAEHPWTLEEARGWIELAKSQGPQTLPWRAKRGDGSLFWVEVTIRMVNLRGLDRVLVTIRDIDESTRIHQELTQLNATLEQRVQERTAEIEQARAASESFGYTVSHDLRAPLRAIDGYAKALLEDHGGKLGGEAASFLERIVSRANRMGRLIDALLDLSRMDRHPVRREKVELDDLVREVVEEVRGPALGDKPDAVAARWVVEPLPSVETDPELAKQVFANLLANAQKFSAPREEPVVSV